MNITSKLREAVRKSWYGEEYPLEVSYEEASDSLWINKWMFLAVAYYKEPITWRGRVLEIFEENKEYFHGDFQGSQIYDRMIMEAVCLLCKSAFENQDERIYKECVLYYHLFCSFYHEFMAPDNKSYVPGTASTYLDLVRDMNYGVLTMTNINSVKSSMILPDHPDDYFQHKANFSTTQLIELRRAGIIPRIEWHIKYIPRVKDEITVRKYRNGFISFCTFLSGGGCPQWLVAVNTSQGKKFDDNTYFINWATEEIPAKEAKSLKTNGPIPVTNLEDRIKFIVHKLKLGPETYSKRITKEIKKYDYPPVKMPDTINSYHQLYGMSPSSFFGATRFKHIVDQHCTELRDAVLLWLIQNRTDDLVFPILEALTRGHVEASH